MALHRLYRTLVVLAVGLLLLALASAATFCYLGGYWENWSPLDRISGPQRFRQFVARPIPSSIYDIRGGYSGWPQGEVATYFHFHGDIEANAFLRNWQELTLYDSTAPFVPHLLVIGANRVYMQPATEGYRYLLISETSHRGILYIPWLSPDFS